MGLSCLVFEIWPRCG